MGNLSKIFKLVSWYYDIIYYKKSKKNLFFSIINSHSVEYILMNQLKHLQSNYKCIFI